MRVSPARITAFAAASILTVAVAAVIAPTAHAERYDDEAWNTLPGYTCSGGLAGKGLHDTYFSIIEGSDCVAANDAPETGKITFKKFVIKEPDSSSKPIKWLCQSYKGYSGQAALPKKVTGQSCYPTSYHDQPPYPQPS
ncbi:hypothetical protein ACFWF7_11275 [Nocardia sp. NPDC060256]|uniref:hypothetical protein n=1 Tax=unclassified Nocardia TaxID=2637762 RepID=UPI00365AA970